MQWKTVAAVVLAVLILVAGPGLLQKCYDAEHGEGALQERVPYGPQEPEPVTFATEIVLDPQAQTAERAQAIDTDGQAWAQDAKGERTPVGWLDLTTTEDTSWRREIVRLGQAQAATIARATTQGGVATFDTPGGTVSACVYKARTPDVPLEGVAVYLLEMIAPEGATEPTGRYAVMVDDPWWGRRIQPAEFAAAPRGRFVMYAPKRTHSQSSRNRGRIDAPYH